MILKYININKMSNICENCNEKDTIISDEESGKIYCQNCGLVCKGKILSDDNDKRTFEGNDGEKKIQRVDPLFNSNKIGSTLIIRNNGISIKKKYYKLDRKQRGFQKIEKLLSSGKVHKNLIEETKTFYQKVIEEKSMKGRNVNNIILGIFYYVCRKAQIAKTFKQISSMFNVEERKIKKSFNSIKSFIVEPTDKEEEMTKVVENLISSYLIGKNKKEVKDLASQINKNLIERGLLEGKSPRTLAGISLFLSFKLLNDNLIDEKEFYDYFSSKPTLKKSFDKIKNSLNLVLPEKFTLEDNCFD